MKDTLHEAIQLAKYVYERDNGDWPEDEHFGSVLTCETLAAEVRRLESKAAEIKKVVDGQAENHGLWFQHELITEDILQKELRRLHAVIESRPQKPTYCFHHPDCNWWKWDWRYSWSPSDCTCEQVAGPPAPDAPSEAGGKAYGF